MVSEEMILEALGGLRGRVRGMKIFEGTVSVQLVPGAEDKGQLRQMATEAIARVPGVEEVFVDFAAPAEAGGGAPGGHAHGKAEQPAPRGIPGVKHVIAVGAGKGGVGKSTVAVNLAVGLVQMGKKVALLDGDIYGPSIPTLTGIPPQPPQVVGERIIPFTVSDPANRNHSLRVMSIGFMVDKEKALIWRGPMAHSAMKQMIEQVVWVPEENGAEGELDFLIVDLPPGTGDVSLTLAQTVPLTGAVIVATPQEVALADARRAVRMFQQLGVEILGVVENMSQFICEHGTAYDIFGRGGAQLMAQEMGLPFLGDLPIEMGLRRNSDAGTPFENFAADSPARGPLLAVADMLEKQVAVRMATRPAAKPLNLRIS